MLFGETGEDMRWFLLPCEAQDYLRSSKAPSSCVDYKPKFFPGLPTTTKQNPVNGVGGGFEKMNFHYCGCTPYRTEYTSRQVVAPPPSSETTRLDTDSEIVKKVREDITTYLELDDKKPPAAEGQSDRTEKLGDEKVKQRDRNGHVIEDHNSSNVEHLNDIEKTITTTTTTIPTTQIEINGDSEQCTLLCKPVPQRTLTMKNNNNGDEVTKTDSNLRFFNPPKEIFKPTVEVSMSLLLVYSV